MGAQVDSKFYESVPILVGHGPRYMFCEVCCCFDYSYKTLPVCRKIEMLLIYKY